MTTITLKAKPNGAICLVLHTPCAEAAKMWIGAAGSTSTHAVVFGQLIDADGNRHGMQAVLAQLRDPISGQVLPGVRILDTGAKHGRNGLDNGILMFDSVELPASNLLSRYVRIGSDGTVDASPMQQIAFAAIVEGRILMVSASGYFAAAGLTIAARYASWRRQFPSRKPRALDDSEEGKPLSGALKAEARLMDYALTRIRLAPIAGMAFACRATFMHLKGVHKQVQAALGELERNMAPKQEGGRGMTLEDAAGGTSGISKLQFLLKKMHVLSSCSKAMATWSAHDGIEECRRLLGGMGYMSYTGLSSLANDFSVMCSWEGDNHVMMLQCGRALAKSGADYWLAMFPTRGAVRQLVGSDRTSNLQRANTREMLDHCLSSACRATRKAIEAAAVAREEATSATSEDVAAPAAVEAASAFAVYYATYCAILLLREHELSIPSAALSAIERSVVAWLLSVARERGMEDLPSLHEWDVLESEEARGDVLGLAEAWNISDWALSTCAATA